MGPIWGREDPCWPHVVSMNLAIRVSIVMFLAICGHSANQEVVYVRDWHKTKWLTFDKRHFQVRFLELKLSRIFIQMLLKSGHKVELTISQHCIRWWFGTGEEAHHYLNPLWPSLLSIYAPLGLDGLNWSNQITIITGYMITSSNGNIFRVTGHLCGEFTGPRWIPRTKASDAELWCFLSSASE